MEDPCSSADPLETSSTRCPQVGGGYSKSLWTGGNLVLTVFRHGGNGCRNCFWMSDLVVAGFSFDGIVSVDDVIFGLLKDFRNRLVPSMGSSGVPDGRRRGSRSPCGHRRTTLEIAFLGLSSENSRGILYCVLQSKVTKIVGLGVRPKIISVKGSCITIKIPFCD